MVGFVDQLPFEWGKGIFMISSRIQLWLLAAEILGLSLSLVMVAMHFNLISQEAVPCPRGAIFACGSILKGPWSVFLGVPWALWGALYFLGMGVLTIIGPKNELWRWLKAAGLLSGLLVVASLRGVELVHLRRICPMCWGVALITLTQILLAWSWIPRIQPFSLPARMGLIILSFFATLGISLTAILLTFDVRRAPAPETAFRLVAQSPLVEGFDSQPVSPDVAFGQVRSGSETSETRVNAVQEALVSSAPAAVGFQNHPGSPIEGPETDLLRQRNWAIVANPFFVEEALSFNRELIIFAYDPLCEECHWVMKNVLGAPEFQLHPALLALAVEESALPPRFATEVRQVPTILLFNNKGEVVWNHAGRLSVEELVKSLQEKLVGNGTPGQ